MDYVYIYMNINPFLAVTPEHLSYLSKGTGTWILFYLLKALESLPVQVYIDLKSRGYWQFGGKNNRLSQPVKVSNDL